MAKVAANLWHETPAARRLLASCVANPPRTVRALAPMADWLAGTVEVDEFDRNDERVEALSRLSDAAFIAAENAGADRAQLRDWLMPQQAIADAIHAASARRAA